MSPDYTAVIPAQIDAGRPAKGGCLSPHRSRCPWRYRLEGLGDDEIWVDVSHTLPAPCYGISADDDVVGEYDEHEVDADDNLARSYADDQEYEDDDSSDAEHTYSDHEDIVYDAEDGAYVEEGAEYDDEDPAEDYLDGADDDKEDVVEGDGEKDMAFDEDFVLQLEDDADSITVRDGDDDEVEVCEPYASAVDDSRGPMLVRRPREYVLDFDSYMDHRDRVHSPKRIEITRSPPIKHADELDEFMPLQGDLQLSRYVDSSYTPWDGELYLDMVMAKVDDLRDLSGFMPYGPGG
ncbi:uncharacterized protein C8Q71DRAFT_462338 [Rhodofomes roseus]|uniref:Uncharacterized protein n=1 Tax=Rhodofomes roseus TaxID=34475 RepID=A0ABQ8KMZ6_9APHY|nr:uncharacterized protein C8Q71DRAFT_462338 [Rhodofomes roseus]KAH9839789.1 hypothetical protein C8Q71DRAFT_462338 [Rhodofomes roseus]